MTVRLLVLASMVFFLPAYGQKPAGDTSGDQQTAQAKQQDTPYPVSPSAGTINVINQQAPDDQRDRSADKPEGYFNTLIAPNNVANVILAIIGAVGIVVAICTLKKINDQTTATQVAAQAALLNAKAVISSERPWILVNIVQAEENNDVWIVEAVNAGRTPGEVFDGHLMAELNTLDFAQPSTDYEGIPVAPLNPFVVNGTRFEVHRFSPNQMCDAVTKNEMATQGFAYFGRAVYVYGRISYWDVFTDRSHPDAKPYVTQWMFRYDAVRKKFVRGEYSKNT